MLYLASRSPRRRQLLQSLNIPFESLAVDIEEIWDGEESAADYVSRLAAGKAEAGRLRVDQSSAILASDTEVVLDGEILGKPEDSEHAFAMLMRLSGRSHKVYSAVALLQDDMCIEVSVNQLRFREFDAEECRRYCDSGEPLGKAGAYAIQGRAAAFITRLEGSYSAVMGLPLKETKHLLKTGDRPRFPEGKNVVCPRFN